MGVGMRLEESGKLLRIFLGESDRYGHRSLAEAIVERAQKEGLAGATVLRGIEGFGASGRLHTTRILRLCEDLPRPGGPPPHRSRPGPALRWHHRRHHRSSGEVPRLPPGSGALALGTMTGAALRPAMDPAGASPAGRPAWFQADGSWSSDRGGAMAEADQREPESSGPTPFGELDLTLAEVKHLVWFLDGSIMSPDVRQHLWRSWGFCCRHTWAYAAAELELRSGFLLGLSILYEDLTGRAVAVLRRPWRSAKARLRATDFCFTCDYASFASGDPLYEKRWRRINRRVKTREMLAATRNVWEPRSCPFCLGGGGIPCRPHLLAGTAAAGPEAAEALEEIRRRLDVFRASFTWRGPTATHEEKASWVEALGWFAGWEFPARVVGVWDGARR